MSKLVVFIASILVLSSCQKSEVVSDFTGNETKYALPQASTYPISGVVTLKERKDGSTTVLVELSGTQGDAKFPVHLHLGDLSTPKAAVAALLTPALATTGKSETVLTALADETTVSYQKLIAMNACIKIHLADVGSDRDVILAGGNIGKSATTGNASGRLGFADCKSE